MPLHFHSLLSSTVRLLIGDWRVPTSDHLCVIPACAGECGRDRRPVGARRDTHCGKGKPRVDLEAAGAGNPAVAGATPVARADV